jgi:hypothetical protein
MTVFYLLTESIILSLCHDHSINNVLVLSQIPVCLSYIIASVRLFMFSSMIIKIYREREYNCFRQNKMCEHTFLASSFLFVCLNRQSEYIRIRRKKKKSINTLLSIVPERRREIRKTLTKQFII